MTRFISIGLALGLAAAALTGCSGAGTSQISILNESKTEIRYNAWVEGAPIPDESTDRSLASEASSGMVLEHPGESSPKIAIRVSPASAPRNAYTAQMSPPGPYSLGVRGDESRLLLVRYDGPEQRDRIVPPDPHQRGLTDDIPRPNTNFGNP